MTGGYVAPGVLEGIEYVFSAGVAENSDFEYELAEKQIPINLIDFSVDRPAKNHELFEFTKAALAPNTLGEQLLSLDDWVKSTETDSSKMLLKMDIEGD